MPNQYNPNFRFKNISLPGIDNDRPASYTCVFFGAPREYGPEEGWQVVTDKRAVKRRRRRVAKQEQDE